MTLPKPNTNGPTLTVIGDNNLGSIVIKTAKKEPDSEDETEE